VERRGRSRGEDGGKEGKVRKLGVHMVRPPVQGSLFQVTTCLYPMDFSIFAVLNGRSDLRLPVPFCPLTLNLFGFHKSQKCHYLNAPNEIMQKLLSGWLAK